MPSGRTHDSITLWSLPVIAIGTFGLTRSGNLTLFVCSGFLFSGLMFGPDLDIYSQQYKRWGVLRWIWLPYRKRLRHRSFLSHGLIVGTIGRLVYLSLWIALLGMGLIFGGAIVQQAIGLTEDWQLLAQQRWQQSTQVLRQIPNYPMEGLALAIGLELGSMSHSLSDWSGSSYKRWQKKRRR